MAIIEEIIGKWVDNETDLVRRTTDSETTYLRKVGTDEYYDEAVDLATASYIYEEVSKPVPPSVETVGETEQEGDEPSANPMEVE